MKTLGPMVLLLPFLCFVGCTKSAKDEGDDTSRVRPTVTVRSVPVRVGEAFLTVNATGKTDVLQRGKVFSPVAGTIATLNVLEGSFVRTGDLLATILTKESQAAIAGAEILLRMAKTEQQRAEAERALQLARSTKNVVAVVAHDNGVIGSRLVSQGEIVPENAELLTIVDLSSVVFMAEVPLEGIVQVHAGMAARIRLAAVAGKDFPATVDAILPRSDLQSQTVAVRLRFTGPRRGLLLRPDMGGTVEVITGKELNALLVPPSALLRDDEKGTYAVVIITADSLSQSIPVLVGVKTDSSVQVISPLLHAGSAVITEGNYMIPDSTRVATSPLPNP